MRIALTYPRISLVGGIERVVVEFANQLARSGHEVRLYGCEWTPGVLDDAVRRNHVAVRRRPDVVRSLQYRRRAAAALASARPLADAHVAFSSLSPVGGVYWVPSVHRSAYDLIISRRGPAAAFVQRVNPFHRLRLELERRLYAPGAFARIVAQTDAVKADILRYYDVPERDIVVQPNGYDPGEFNPERRAALRPRARERLGYGDDDRVVAFVANELERKGFDTLLRGAAPLDVRLHVVGAVDEREYGALIDELGMRERVRFVGRATDVAFHLAAADVFALPSRYEPWGLVIVEALASGLPVLTTRLAGAAVAVQDGRTGALLDDPDDAAELERRLAALLNRAPVDSAEMERSVAWLAWPQVARRWEEEILPQVRT